MNFAREKGAKAWCGEKTSSKTIDVELAEEFAKILVEEMYTSHLGYATTGELIEELKSRVGVNYKTIVED